VEVIGDWMIAPFQAMKRVPETAQARAEYQALESKRCRLVEQRNQILAKYAEVKMKQTAERHAAACPICQEEQHHVTNT